MHSFKKKVTQEVTPFGKVPEEALFKFIWLFESDVKQEKKKNLACKTHIRDCSLA